MLVDMIAAIDKLQVFIKGREFDDFLSDDMFHWACERGIEIVSEASKKIPDELRSQHPAIPWQSVRAIGNVLRHEYNRIDNAAIWNTLQHDLTPLRHAIVQ